MYVPLRVSAVPQPGYRFVRWQGASASTNTEITIIRNSSGILTALFEPISLSADPASGGEGTYKLFESYPNPFNPSTTIGFRVPVDVDVSLAIYNALGQKVAQLVEGKTTAGYHSVVFDASDLASGLYICRMQAGSFLSTKKLVLLK
jgi:hypothetical protein